MSEGVQSVRSSVYGSPKCKGSNLSGVGVCAVYEGLVCWVQSWGRESVLWVLLLLLCHPPGQ